MFFNNNLERPDAFIDERIMFKVSPSSGLNLTHLRTNGPWLVVRDLTNCANLANKNWEFLSFDTIQKLLIVTTHCHVWSKYHQLSCPFPSITVNWTNTNNTTFEMFETNTLLS